MKEYYDSYMVYKEKLYIYEVVENNPCASVNDIDTAKKELDDSLWNWFMKCYSALGANNGVSIDGFHGEIVCYSYNLMWGGRVLFSWHYSFNNYPNNWNETIGNKLIKFGENEWKRKLE